MAYVINPDGTVDMLDVEYDAYGNMRPKRRHDSSTPSSKSSSSVGNKKRKKGNNPPIAKSSPSPSPSKRGGNIVVRVAKNITKQSIDKFFSRKKELGQLVTNDDLLRAAMVMPSKLLRYFMNKYEQYKEYCSNGGLGQKIPFVNKKSKKKNMKKKKHAVESVVPNNSAVGHTIADVAKFSSVKDSMADTDVIYKRHGPSRPPKYGYARDYFGRVQERDSFNDDKKNEFKQAQRSQSRYDYSGYDAEDDHDSYYDSDGYE